FSELLADRLHDRDVLADVVGVEPQLHRAEPLVEDPRAVLDAAAGVAHLARRAVRRDAVLLGAPELVGRQTRDLPDDVPQRDLDAVDGRTEDLGVAQDPDQPLGRGGVLADQVRGDEAVYRDGGLRAGLRGRAADRAAGGLELDDRGEERRLHLAATPRRSEFRRQRQVDDAAAHTRDRCRQHALSLYASSATGVDVDRRLTSCTGTRVVVGAPFTLPSMRPIIVSIPRRASSSRGWATVVSPMRASPAIGTSSKPTIERSSGTRRPALSAKSIRSI